MFNKRKRKREFQRRMYSPWIDSATHIFSFLPFWRRTCPRGGRERRETEIFSWKLKPNWLSFIFGLHQLKTMKDPVEEKTLVNNRKFLLINCHHALGGGLLNILNVHSLHFIHLIGWLASGLVFETYFDCVSQAVSGNMVFYPSLPVSGIIDLQHHSKLARSPAMRPQQRSLNILF